MRPACARRLTLMSATLLLCGCAASRRSAELPTRRTDNVILVLVDGLRWQEVFFGADEALMNKDSGGVRDVDALRARFWRDTPEARRQALMPFIWHTVAARGQLFGNQQRGSIARVANGRNFSYPGYSEMLCGYPDDRIDSNDKKPNPNITVFEWLSDKRAVAGRVAAFGSWDVVPWIFNRERCGFVVVGGKDPVTVGHPSEKQALCNRLKTEIPSHFGNDPSDAVTFHAALEYFIEHKPRLFYLSFGETDEWAHAGRYDEYLTAAWRTDMYLRMLWETCQSMHEHRNRTTLIVAPDHGRGDAPTAWKSHNQDTPGSENIWIAILGPDTPPLGERHNTTTVTVGQIASTIAALLDENYCAAQPKAAAPLPDALASPHR
jgi:hypothetical protein